MVTTVIRKATVLILLLAAISSLAIAADIDSLEKKLDRTTDESERALLYKNIGDQYVAREDYISAARAYVNALSIERSLFTLKERTKMALYLSWADRLGEAIEEFKLVLLEDPGNVDARVNLARVLSWDGKNNEAIEETDRVLTDAPDNRDALLVKANALRWKGEISESIPIYEKLLDGGEDFDARLGLTYAYVTNGNVKEARESYQILTPKFKYQEREYQKVTRVVNRETRPNLDGRYGYYNDTDQNERNRFWLSYHYWTGRWKTNIFFRHTDAKDATRKNRAEDLWVKSYGRASDLVSAGGGLGLTRLGNGDRSNYVTGHIRGDIRFLRGKIGAVLARDVFSDTAQLIENRIRFYDGGAYITQNLPGRVTLSLSYSYKDYSDDNNSNSLHAVLKYTILPGQPSITIGLRPRYVDFERQSGGGYFDPDNYYATQAFLSLYSETDTYYSYLEPFFGLQTYERFGEDVDDTYFGAFGSLGWKISKNTILEINGEGGNYALATSSGFEYYQVGFIGKLFF